MLPIPMMCQVFICEVIMQKLTSSYLLIKYFMRRVLPEESCLSAVIWERSALLWSFLWCLPGIWNIFYDTLRPFQVRTLREIKRQLKSKYYEETIYGFIDPLTHISLIKVLGFTQSVYTFYFQSLPPLVHVVPLDPVRMLTRTRTHRLLTVFLN